MVCGAPDIWGMTESGTSFPHSQDLVAGTCKLRSVVLFSHELAQRFPHADQQDFEKSEWEAAVLNPMQLQGDGV